MRKSLTAAIAAVAFGATGSALGAPVDGVTLNRIADEAFNHGEVVETAAYLSDRIGGRLTNSPAMRSAERWTQDQFKRWGLKDVHTEAFEFGRGWWIESCAVRMTAPRPLAVHAIPIAWTPATNGVQGAAIVVAPMAGEADFAQWQGKLSGKIVLVSWPAPPKDEVVAPFQRLTETDIARLDRYREPVTNPETEHKALERRLFKEKMDAFLAREGAVAWAQMSRSDGRLVHGEGYAFRTGSTPRLPGFEFGAEDYRRLARLALGGEVRLEIDSRVRFEDGDHNAYNVFADIRGKDSKEYVMAGAHLDSWVAADGAADNGAGVAVVMEAARILAALGVEPRRTIRFALWAGEEQGLLGSAAYAAQHLAHRPPGDATLTALGPYFGSEGYPVQALPGFADLAAYFNLDNGSGKIRGIYTEGNFAVVPVLRDWLAPFGSLGVATVAAEPTDSTDHVMFSRLGLPAFQFVQDPLDYETRVHHTDLDSFDHLRPEDLRQAAVIMAAVLLDAADAGSAMPRKVLPTAPRATDPFRYAEPSKP